MGNARARMHERGAVRWSMPAMGVAGCRHFKSAIPRTWAARTQTVSVGMLRAVCAWHVGGGMVGDAAVTAVSKRMGAW